MAGAFEIAFAAGLALVGVSFGAVVLDRVSEKFLITATVILTRRAVLCAEDHQHCPKLDSEHA